MSSLFTPTDNPLAASVHAPPAIKFTPTANPAKPPPVKAAPKVAAPKVASGPIVTPDQAVMGKSDAPVLTPAVAPLNAKAVVQGIDAGTITTDPHVKGLQTALVKIGYPIKVTGYMNDQTLAAIHHYQSGKYAQWQATPKPPSVEPLNPALVDHSQDGMTPQQKAAADMSTYAGSNTLSTYGVPTLVHPGVGEKIADVASKFVVPFKPLSGTHVNIPQLAGDVANIGLLGGAGLVNNAAAEAGVTGPVKALAAVPKLVGIGKGAVTTAKGLRAADDLTSAIGAVKAGKTAAYAGGSASPSAFMAGTVIANNTIGIPGGIALFGEHPIKALQETASNFRHGLLDYHDPLMMAIDWGAIGAAASGTGARLWAGHQAFISGSGPKDVLTRSSANGGSLLHVPNMPARYIRLPNGEMARLLESQNPVMRGFQSAYDSVLQRALDRNPEGGVARHAKKRVAGYQVSARRIEEEHGMVLPRALGAKLARGVRNPGILPARLARAIARFQPWEQRVLTLTAENRPVDDSIKSVVSRVAKISKTPRPWPKAIADELVNHEKELAKLDAIKQAGVTKVVPSGEFTPDGQPRMQVIVDPQVHPRLAAVDSMLALAETLQDKINVETGQLTPQGVRTRLDNPGKVMRGGKYVKPTPGKLGKVPKWLERDRRKVAQMQKAHDRALSKAQAAGEKVVADSTGGVSYVSPMKLVREARTELDPRGYLRDREHRAQIKALAADIKANGIREPLTLRADGTLTDGLHRALAAIAAGVKRVPVVRETEGMIGQKIVGKGHAVGANWSALAERRGAALSVAKDKLQQAEEAFQRRIEPTGIVGGEDPMYLGRGYAPAYISEPKSNPDAPRRSIGRVFGKAKKPMRSASYSGEGQRTSQIPQNTAGLLVSALKRNVRYVQKLKALGGLTRFGTDARPIGADPENYALVNTQEFNNAKIPERVKQDMGKTQTTLETEDAQKLFDAWHEKMIVTKDNFIKLFGEDPAQEQQFKQAFEQGTAVKGYKWVDKNLIGSDLTQAASGGSNAFMQGVDAVTNLEKNLIVYMKPGHFATRFMANAGFNLMQGALRPDNMVIASDWWFHHMDPMERGQALAIAGQGYSQALAGEERGIGATLAHSGAHFYARWVDSPSRFLALVKAARRYGYDTFPKFQELLSGEDPKTVEDRNHIGIVANRESGDYARLGPAEQRIVRRWIFFYPWLKTSVFFAGRALTEHPIKSAALLNLGASGTQMEDQRLGKRDYRDQGLVPFGSGANLQTSNFGGLSPFETPAQAYNTVDAGLGGQPSLGENQLGAWLGPVPKAGIDFAMGLTPFGDKAPPNQSSFQNIMYNDWIAGTPPYILGKALLHPQPLADQANKEFPVTGGSQASRFFAGSWFPRDTNKDSMNYQGYKEDATVSGNSGGLDTYNLRHLVDQIDPSLQIPQNVLDQIQVRDDLMAKMKKGMDVGHRAMVAAQYYAQQTGNQDVLQAAEQVQHDPARAQVLYHQIREHLYGDYLRYKAEATAYLHRKQAQQASAAG